MYGGLGVDDSEGCRWSWKQMGCDEYFLVRVKLEANNETYQKLAMFTGCISSTLGELRVCIAARYEQRPS